MIIECTLAKTYEIDDSLLEEYAKYILTNGVEPDFYNFISGFSESYDLEDMQIDNYCEWSSINGNPNISEEFKNIMESYYD